MTERAEPKIIKFHRRRSPNRIINGAAQITLAASSIATAIGVTWIAKDNFSTGITPKITLQRTSPIISRDQNNLPEIKPPDLNFETNGANFSLVVLGSAAFVVSLGVLANSENKNQR